MSNSLENLQKDIRKASFWKLFVHQLSKDFSRARVALSVNENNSFESVLRELMEQLNKLYLSDSARLERLFYLIDIPQEVYLQIVSSDRELIAERLAQVVLLRTYKKIQLRTLYKS